MKRDSLEEKISKTPFYGKVLHACRSCHKTGIKPGVLETRLGDYGLRVMLPKKYELLYLAQDGLYESCAGESAPDTAGT